MKQRPFPSALPAVPRQANAPPARLAARPRRLATRLARALAGLALLGSASAWAAEAVDHYVLALSWSPTYCAQSARNEASVQCDVDADHTFVVHGLWPNAEDENPAYCQTRQRGPGRSTVRSMMDIMPSEGLIHHQWRKHGTCAGMSAEDYFETVREAAESIVVPAGLATIRKSITASPEVIREAFRRANPDVPDDGIVIACRGDNLVEVRICLTPDLRPRDCPRAAQRRCGTPLLEIDPPR